MSKRRGSRTDLCGFSGVGIATISVLLQIFGILSWCMQEVRKSLNQDLRADTA